MKKKFVDGEKNLREKFRAVAVLLAQSCLLAGIAVFAVMPTGCKLDDNPDGINGDRKPPAIEDVKVVDEKTVEIDFSEPVKVETGGVSESEKSKGSDEKGDENKTESGEKSDEKEDDSAIGKKEESGKEDEPTDGKKDEVKLEEKSEDSGIQKPESEKKDDDKNDETAVEKKDEVKPEEKSDEKVDEENPAGKKDDDKTESGEKSEGKKPEISYDEDNSKVTITLPEETEPGKEYVVSGTVEDDKGNTLTFAIPFKGYNGNLPKLVMTEIQTEGAPQSSTDKKNGVYRDEFVEFLALSDGNLAGFELISANDGEERKYSFPSCNVKKGEIFVVHLRKRGNGCISETGDDLDLATGGYSHAGIRDLWSDSETTALGNDTDVIYLKNSADGSIWDGIMFRGSKVNEWSKKLAPSVEKLVQIGFYADGEVSSATLTDEKTTSKTLNRKNAFELLQDALNGKDFSSYPSPVTSEDWIVAKESAGAIKEL